MDKSGPYEASQRVVGVAAVAEFAGDLLDAPRPRLTEEQEADDRVVDLALRETSAPRLLWNTLVLHGKDHLSVPGPGQLALRRGHLVLDYTCTLQYSTLRAILLR
jgi:hypothetical protein